MKRLELSETDSTGRDLTDEVQAISQLTGYPQAVVKDIVEADRMYVLDRICDDMHDVGMLPDRYTFTVPALGDIRLTRMSGGRTTDAKWTFLPSEAFRDGFFNAFYYGISPAFQRARANFQDLMDARARNLLKSRGQSD